MKDVVEALRRHCNDDLTALVRDLEDCETTQRNLLFREFVNRIRKAAGVPPKPAPGRGGLLDLLDVNLEESRR